LIGRDRRGMASSRRHVPHTLTEATPAKFFRTAKELDGVVGVKGRNAELHGAKVLVAKREDVRAHVVEAYHRHTGTLMLARLATSARKRRGAAQRLQLGSHLETHAQTDISDG